MEGIHIRDRRIVRFARVDLPIIMATDLTTYEKMVYVALCAFASREDTCYPSVKKLAEAASCSDRQVRRCLDVLERRGFIAREERFCSDEGQTSNIYDIIGATEEKKYPPLTVSHTPPDCQSAELYVLEPEKDINTTPSGGEVSPGANLAAESADLPDVPSPMRETVELFLAKTGRKGIDPDELGYVRKLEKLHTPARIQREITTAIERFDRKKRPRDSLRWEYLYDSLKDQRSGKAAQSKQPKAMADERSELSEWEREQQRELERRYGGVGG